MDVEEISSRLKEVGCTIAKTQVNQRGRHVHLVQPWNVAMFLEDVSEVLTGQATLQEIIDRNKGADLGDPWPVP